MQKRPLDLIFPAAGLNRRFAYRGQPPYSTPDCLNVWGVDPIEGRERGGSRPGVGKAFYEELGSGTPVRLLEDLTYYRNDGFTFWADNFEGESLGSVWSVASWVGTAPGILPDNVSGVVYSNSVGAVRDAISDLDTAKAYTIEVFVTPWEGGHKGKYQIYGRMNNTTPIATTDGFVAELVMEDATGAYSGTLKVYDAAGTPVSYAFAASASPIGYAEAGWFKVLVNGNNVSVYWLGNVEINAQDISAGLGAGAGHRMGFGSSCTQAGGFCLNDSFRTQYFKSVVPPYTKQQLLVASAGGTVYYEDTLGTVTTLGGSVNLASNRQLHGDSRAQKLYIADHDEARIVGTGATIGGAGNDELDKAAIVWNTYGIDINNDVAVLSSSSPSSLDGTYKISAVDADKVTLTPAPGAGTCSFRIERAPKIFDPAAGTLTIWFATTAKGSVPTGCPLVARFRDSLFLGGAAANPHLWYKCRGGDPLDWLTGGEDPLRPVAGQDSEAGEIGSPLTAFIPFSDDYMIIGHQTELWIMRGGPAYGGRLGNLSHEVGIISRGAWCRGPTGEVVFQARQGVYIIPPGPNSYPQPISEEPLPEELLNVDPNIYDVSFEYDAKHKGVHIYLTAKAATTRLHWFMDWRRKAFWPVKHQTSHDPTATLSHVSESAEDSAVLLGCRDGYVRRHRRAHETDEGSEISSHITYGPIRLGGHGFREGILQEISGVLARDSGNVDWSVYVGDEHEGVLNKDAFPIDGTWDRNGLNYKSHPRARGGSMLLKLANGETDRRWAIERVSVMALPSGEQKVG